MIAGTFKQVVWPQAETWLAALGTVAIAAVFLPFTWNTSPWDVTGYALYQGDIDVFFFLGAPFLLAFVISGASLVLLLTRSLPSAAWITAYTLALAAAGATLFMIAIFLSESSDIEALVSMLPPLFALGVGAGIVIRNARRGLSHEQNAVVAMQAAYIAGAMLPLVIFFSDWQEGAYLTCVSIALYVVHAALLSKN